jgi:hypothetical protein
MAETMVRELFSAAFDAMHEADETHEERRAEFAFHLDECVDDFRAFLDAVAKRTDPDTMSTFLVGFLAHAVPHLNAAGRLLLGKIADPFASREDDESE